MDHKLESTEKRSSVKQYLFLNSHINKDFLFY